MASSVEATSTLAIRTVDESTPLDSNAATGKTNVSPADDEHQPHAEPHSFAEYIKSIVFGGLDGIITTFAIVASVAGADFPIEVVILTGFAKLLGDALSMGLGDCMSEQAEQAHIRGEHKRELWEYENYPEGEVKEMIDIYQEKGLSPEDSKRVIEIMTRKPEYKEFFVEHMVTHELGLSVPDEDDNPIKDGGITFLSFMFWGSIPLWPYVIFYGADYHNTQGQFGICIAITVLCLFGLGAMQAHILKQNRLKQAILMTINGGLAALSAYLVSWGLQHAIGEESACLE